MTPLRKQAVSWFFVLSALTISAIGGSFVYLHNEAPTDPAFIETHLDASRNFDVVGAKKADYSDKEITEFIVKANQAEFNQKWHRLLSIVGSLYLISASGIVAITLRKEASPSTLLE